MLNITANPSNPTDPADRSEQFDQFDPSDKSEKARLVKDTTFLTGNGDHRDTLVVIFLRGGADGLNMLVPVEDDAYYTARTQTAIKKSDTLPLDNLFALHPLLKDLKPLFEEGQLLAVHGAGSEDTTRSHFEAQDYMEHGGITAGGWLGRYLRAANAGTGALSAVALGKTQPECLRGAPGILVMESFESLSFGEKAGQFLDTLLPAYEATPGLIGQAGRDLVAGVRRLAALNQGTYVPEHGAHYPEGAFGQNLARIAQLIKGRVGVRAATVDLDGWDAHFASATLMNPLLRQLGGGLLAFARDLGDTMQHTTVVVMTEFGRRVYENASFGTDHGRGSIMMALGGGVQGGRVLHQWRGLREDALEAPGDVPVAYNYRDVLAPILQRLGPLRTLEQVFPDYPLTPVPVYG